MFRPSDGNAGWLAGLSWIPAASFLPEDKTGEASVSLWGAKASRCIHVELWLD